MSMRDAVTALRRFGLGARPGEIKRIEGDPRGFLLQSLTRPEAARLEHPDLRPSHVTFTEAMVAQRAKRQAEVQRKSAARPDPGTQTPDKPANPPPEAKPPAEPPAATPKPGQVRREAFVEEATQRFLRAAATDAAFVERLVMFWSAHFCVSANKGPVRGIAGAYEREAIRPHVLGRFVDLLLAAETHPAMLIYLDNQVSVGPNSRAGVNRGRGLNENLAREILELHTLGTDGGYTQEDVTNFARILTGWTVGGLDNPAAEPGKYFFAPARHEPGDWTVLGKRYVDQGQLTGQRVLEDLARHPSTARNIARKLVRHFISDKAPASAVERVQGAFLASGGDLASVAKALVEVPEAWSTSPAKILPPNDFLIATVRGLGVEPRPPELLRFGVQLGQPLWRPPSPKGWPDEDDAWTAPSALRERLRIAELAARIANRNADPRQLADELFGDALSTQTRNAIARAEVREQGLELLVMSPEFQRR